MQRLTDDQLLDLLNDLESDRVERKESFKGDVPKKARQAVCAFSNDLPGHNQPGVLFIGANDDQDLDAPSGSVAYGTPEWSKVYAQRVDAMLAAAKDSGAKVLWVGLPRMREARADAHSTLVNGILKERLAAAGHGEFFDIAPLYAVDGKYSPFILLPPNDQVLQVRGEDGIHFNRDGAEHLAGQILGKLK